MTQHYAIILRDADGNEESGLFVEPGDLAHFLTSRSSDLACARIACCDSEFLAREAMEGIVW